ncbi:MAG: substrate-binding domain-containing protein [Thermoplasmata archaeon]|jgi:tungstate transport system substrate-binding protein|nr:substrate-binding domain-containing protein [Thermoplasmata archaeon]
MSLDWKIAVVVVVVGALVSGAIGYILIKDDEGGPKALLLATTTSTYDSGLLDYILPVFEEENDCEIDVIAVGSGTAMELGKNGDVDVLLVHSPTAEMAFVNDGYGEGRDLVMYNNYVLVGSESDPAATNRSANASVAFQKIHDNGTDGLVQFLSRGDSSGTHNKELSIWKTLGLNVSLFEDWYVSTGLGMGDLLDMCEQEDATTPSYTLSDDATYYQRLSEGLIPHLKIVYNYQKTDDALENQYSVIVLNETRFPHINHTLATEFKDWMVSEDGQDLIASYEKYGMQLFYPNAAGYVPGVRLLGSPVLSVDSSVESVAGAPLSVPFDIRARVPIWCG